MIEKLEETFSKYEIARILGARSLQLSMDAPILLKLTKEEEKDLNFDSLKIAERELVAGVLPITVKRPLPKKSERTVKKLTEEEIKERLEKKAKKEEKETKVEAKVEDKKIDEESEEGEEKEEKVVQEEGEIMEMANPEDEEDLNEDDSLPEDYQ